MIRELRLFLTAVQFLTRLPVPSLKDFQREWITASARYYPLVGQIVGAISGLVLVCAAKAWSGAVPAVLAVAAGMIITGAFHEDGLGDTADGLGGGRDKASRLAIMKDSRIGTYAALALLLAVALKIAAFTQISAVLLIVAGHGAARAAAVIAMAALPYAGDADAAKYKPVPQGVGTGSVIVAVVLAAWPFVAFPLPSILPALACGAVLALVMALTARRLIGGVTGDVLGAIEQMFEIGFFLGAVTQWP